jgi:hypothetical protein
MTTPPKKLGASRRQRSRSIPEAKQRGQAAHRPSVFPGMRNTRTRHQAVLSNPVDTSPQGPADVSLRDPGISIKRKRGAPRGNTNARGHGAPKGNKNALKHGYYSRRSRLERDRLARKNLAWLDPEQIVLRYLNGTLLQHLKTDPDLPLKQVLLTVRTIVAASGRVEEINLARCLIQGYFLESGSPVLRAWEEYKARHPVTPDPPEEP